jgi:hypothetical protein
MSEDSFHNTHGMKEDETGDFVLFEDVEKILEERGCFPDGIRYNSQTGTLTVDDNKFSREFFQMFSEEGNIGQVFQLTKIDKFQDGLTVHIKRFQTVEYSKFLPEDTLFIGTGEDCIKFDTSQEVKAVNNEL